MELWSSSTLPPPLIEDESEGDTDKDKETGLTIPKQGCDIDGESYMDGMQIPKNPAEPCELCYCIRNYTACVMQECSLKVPGCEPVYEEGVCCPVKYMCGKFLREVK